MSIPGVRSRRRDPRSVLAQVEAAKWLPKADLERFHGWGVLGLPFASGHVLGLRRWSASSIGPPYTSVWHRAPDGVWTFWSTEEAPVSCNRYAGEVITHSAQWPIAVSWPGDWAFSVEVEQASLWWEVVLAEPPMARALNAVAAGLPDRLRRAGGLLRVLGPAAGQLLGAGPLVLTGSMPNGQRFWMTPYRAWVAIRSRATLAGRDLGDPAPLPEQARVGDFRIPQRGLVAVGSVYFTPLDPARHSTRLALSVG
jgi:hypothetical protein